VRLLLLHAELPTCEDCCRWVYNPTTWQREMRGGKPCERPPEALPPCTSCPKVPKGEPPTPETGRKSELSEKGLQAYMHWRRCKAVGRHPEDDLYEHNAALLQMVDEEAKLSRIENAARGLAVGLLGSLAKG
jgi:hypothetical protein